MQHQMATSGLSETSQMLQDIHKAACNHPTTVDMYVNIYLCVRTKANMHRLESMR